MEGGFGQAYRQQGVTNFYEQQGHNYSNPHKYDIERLLRKKLAPRNPFLQRHDRILDLACGSGEVTLPLKQIGYTNIRGIDPYTQQQYETLTGIKCESLTFADILNGALDAQCFEAIIISYALHLVKESMLHGFCTKLAQISKMLIIISPHKFPTIKSTYGWTEIDNYVMDRVHFRAYNSQLFQQAHNQL